jgi:hypothetical protein
LAAIGLLVPLPEWTVEDHVAFDAAWGFTASAVSLVPPACAFGDVADRRATARAVNEYGAKLIADHGERFAVFGTSSLPDVVGAVTGSATCSTSCTSMASACPFFYSTPSSGPSTRRARSPT